MKFIYLILFSIITLNVTAQSKPVTVVPFTMEKNTIFIYCKVNEKDSIKFLFDTGANGSVINSSAKKLDLKIDGQSQNQGSNGVNTVEESSGNRVAFGTIERTNVSLTLIPFGTTDFDGVFGTDLMKGNIVEIDYTKKEIRFFQEGDKGIDFSGYEKRKLHMVDNYPAVESKLIVNGVKIYGIFGLDSGADDVLTIASPFAKKKKLENKMKKIGASFFQGSDGSEYEMPIVLCPAIEFSGKFLYNIPIALSNSVDGIDATKKMAGFYGNNFLKRFNTIIDFKHELIYFKLNDQLYSPFD